MLCVGQRFILNNEKGTILYVGYIQTSTQSSQLWYGVEWDNPERGKHSGMKDGIQYFKVNFEGAGSFIKTNVRLEESQTFLAALLDKYTIDPTTNSHQVSKIKFGSKQQISIETIGFQKVYQRQSDLRNLTEVALQHHRIQWHDPIGSIKDQCPNIVDLDLSHNLLDDWKVIFSICEELKLLRILRLNDNHIQPFFAEANRKPKTLESINTLILNKTKHDMRSLMQIIPIIPNITELYFGWNQLEEWPKQYETFDRLQILGLESNTIRKWEEIDKLKFTNISHLILDGNGLENIQYQSHWNHLISISLSDNNIDNWQSVHELNRFPVLTKIKIKRNPVLSKIQDEDAKYVLIGRLSKVEVLNHSKVSDRDRLDSELFYLKEAFKELGKSNDKDFHCNHPMYRDLCSKYGEPIQQNEKINSGLLQHHLLEIMLHLMTDPSSSITKLLSPSMTIRSLKTFSSKLFSLRKSKIIIFHSVDEILLDNKLDCQKETLDDDLKTLEWYNVESGHHFYIDIAE